MRNSLISTLRSFNLQIDQDLLNDTIDQFNLGKESCYFIYDLNSDKCLYFCPSISGIVGYDHRKYVNKSFLFFKNLIHPTDFLYFIDEIITLISTAENISSGLFTGNQSGVSLRIQHKDGNWQSSRVYLILLKETNQSNLKVLVGFVKRVFAQDENARDISSVITEREKEVFRYLSEGNSAKMIADRLSISENTVITHRKNLIQKLSVKNSAELISRGLKLNILNLPPVFS